ncbi:TGF-beta receptor type-2 [Salmo trutta]|uniref:TGF-beta receptor type-2 n=1 Tax=Salmo trutta TaxID=8032 RepID=UPI0011318077|nr:TGF-beta receptor type-2-like [Salmo trutta]
MERRGFSLLCWGSIAFLFISVLEPSAVDGMFQQSFSLKKLCMFCDVESSSCNGTGSCLSNCSITSICPLEQEVCIAIWRKNDGNYSIETLCHDPSQPLYGVVLDDYNSSTCSMKEKKSSGGPLFICSCTEEECNNNLEFAPGEYLPVSEYLPASVN